MTGKAAIVTGGAKRLGAEIAMFLAKKGYDIALHYNHSIDEAKIVQAAIQREGVKCQLFHADLLDNQGLESLIDKIFEWSDTCNILVNNASVFDQATFRQTDQDLFEREFNINFKAPFFLSNAFARKASKGLIVNMLDSRIRSNDISHYAYTLSKKVLYEHTLMAALELAPAFRVNGICPGPILPPSGTDSGSINTEGVPLGRHGKISEILKALDYLIDNDFVTGECLFVDGGKKLNW